MAEEQTELRMNPMRKVDLLCREAAGQPFRPVVLTGDRLRVGRRFENDLVLSHASVSRFHAEIVREGDRWFVVDCDSKFGTSLNGERIVRADLSPGDEIRIGGDDGPVLVFHPVTPVDGVDAETEAEAPVDTAQESIDEGPAVQTAPSLRATGDAMRLVEQFRATSLIGDYHEALALVADAALELTHFDCAALLLADRVESDDDSLRAEVVRSRVGHTVQAEAERATPLVRAAIEAGRAVVIASVGEASEEDPELVAIARTAGIGRAVCVPLRTLSFANLSTTGEAYRVVVGALYLEAGNAAPPVTEGVRGVLESLANEAGFVVERLYARQVSIARIRAAQAVAAAQMSVRAADASLSLAARARAACELATYLLLIGDFDGATAALEAFEDPATRASLPDTARAEVLRTLGNTLMWDSRWHRAVGVLNAALDAATEGQSLALEMSVRTYLARCYTEIGELEIAREHALTAASVLRRTDETSADYARALLALGLLDEIDRDTTSAAHTFRAAARVAEQTEDLLVRAVAHYRLGIVLADRGDTADAIASFQRALEVAQPVGNPSLLLMGQCALARCLVRSGVWRRAEAVIAAGLASPNENRYGPPARAHLQLLAATIAVRRDGGRAAAAAVDEVRAHAARLEDRSILAEVYLLEAELRTETRDFEGARMVLAAAAEVARDLESSSLRARVHLAHAELERRERNYDLADHEIVLAQGFVNESHDLALAGAAQLAVGRLHAERGRFTEAQHSLAQSLSIFRTVDDRRQIGAVHLDLGNMMLAAGDPACARTHLQLAREVFSDLGIAWALEAAETGLAAALAQGGASAPASYSSIILGARSEPRFVRRLLEATQSRALLLRELTSIAIDVTHASAAAVVSCTADGAVDVAASSGEELGRELPVLAIMRAAQGEVVRTGELTLYPIEGLAGAKSDMSAAVLAIGDAIASSSRADVTLQVVVQLARQGLELVMLRSSLKRADLPEPPRFSASDESGDGSAVAEGLIFASSVMRQLAERLHRIRTSSATVLVTGESGVGKELIARAIHAASPRPRAPFVPYNCSAAPRELIESQLFGHKRGAFTGATGDNPGVARAARNGTLFLDEVGDLPLDLQPKLLRFLESGEIQPLGENTPLRVEVRVVAATNAELERAVEERRFREDLFHRLNIIRLHVPPLRDRVEDIPLLVSHFLARLAERAGFQRPPSISEDALALLVAYPWPGNVRQLRNEIERVVTFGLEGTTITRDHLSPEIVAYNSVRTPAELPPSGRACDAGDLTLADRLRLFEIEQITTALAESGLNLTRAATTLGMARQNLQRRIKKLGLKSPEP
jgi:transcriptional regulator with GAF, ATPase, and Fis domain